MLLPEFFAWLLSDGWLMLLHLRARSAFPGPLSREEEARLTRAMLAGDRSAADRLIEHNLRLVAHIAKKYARSGAEQEELVSVGALGLIKAVRSFRPEAGRLSAYASRCIENEMLMFLRAGRKHRGDVPMGEILSEDKDGAPLELGDLLGTDPDIVPDAAETAIEYQRAVSMMRTVLNERERRVVALRYGLSGNVPLPQHEVARRLGISRSYVSRIEKRALEKLRRALN